MSVVVIVFNEKFFILFFFQVVWFKSGASKFFEYINGRDPPFRNLTLVGAEIDVSFCLSL